MLFFLRSSCAVGSHGKSVLGLLGVQCWVGLGFCLCQLRYMRQTRLQAKGEFYLV